MDNITFRSVGLVSILFVCIGLLAGCQSMNERLNPRPPVDVAETVSVRPQPIVVPAISNGAIFQAGHYRPLFEDHRARLVGDTLTVQIVEKVSATQKSTSSVDKGGKVTGGVTALPFLSANSFNRASVAGSSSNSFEGKGSTENSNDFSGTITATVTEVLANGHLLISDSAHSAHNTGLFNSWLHSYGDLAANAAKNLQPIWSLPRVKVAQFKDAYAAAVDRVQNIANQLGLKVPASITA